MSSSWMISFTASLKPRDRSRPARNLIGVTAHEPEIPNKTYDEKHRSYSCFPSTRCSKSVPGERAPGSRRADILRGNGGFRRERHLEGESWLWDVEYGGELDACY